MRARARLCVGAAATLSLVLGAAACGSKTAMTDVWTEPNRLSGPMRSILVIGARMDETSRRSLEDGFAQALAEHGVRATPSYTLFPNALPTPQVAREAVRSAGYDGLLVAESKGTSEKTTVVPGQYDFWTGYYYGPGWEGWYPGYVYTDTYVKFETTLWATSSGQLAWSAITETKNPSSGKDFVASLTGKVVPALARAGFIPPKGAAEQLSQVRVQPASEHR